MIHFNELQIGDYVNAEFEGSIRQGEVVRLNADEKQVCVLTDVQEFWYETNKLHAIEISDEQLLKLNFTKQENEDGSVKYMKGSFRIQIPAKNNFNVMEIWYREDRRHLNAPIKLHELQNHYFTMTKIHLTNQPM